MLKAKEDGGGRNAEEKQLKQRESNLPLNTPLGLV